jgi:glycine betaine/proline transport system substrate-binding protein
MPRRLLRLLVVPLLLAGPLPAAAQDVPPLSTPDVTTLVAPAGGTGTTVSAGDANDAAAPSQDTDAPPPPCGTQPITIARMAWPSAAILAEIHARLLKSQFQCTVQVLPSDLAPAVTGMAQTGQPAVAPEMWIDRVADAWNQAVKDQKLRQVGVTYADSQFEGWYVPSYVADGHPELGAATAIAGDAKLFAEAGGKGRFISCPTDWACAVINRNLLKALGLDQFFTIVEPKNRFDLDQTIAAAVSRKQPILFYYWQPNATLAQFDFRSVSLGAYSKDDFACLGQRACASPKPSGFAPEPVVIALAEWVFTGAPEVAAYFQRAQMPMEVMNQLLEDLSNPGATAESVADRFVAEHQDIWQKWVGTPPTPPSGNATPAAPAPATAAPAAAPSAAPPARRRTAPPAVPPDRSGQPLQAPDPIIKY